MRTCTRRHALTARVEGWARPLRTSTVGTSLERRGGDRLSVLRRTATRASGCRDLLAPVLSEPLEVADRLERQERAADAVVLLTRRIERRWLVPKVCNCSTTRARTELR